MSVFSTCWDVRGGKMWVLCQPSHDSHLSACCQRMQTRRGLSWFSPVKLNWITLQLQRDICVWAVTTEQLQMRACLHLSITVLSTAKATPLLSQLGCCVRCSALATLLLLLVPTVEFTSVLMLHRSSPNPASPDLTTLLYFVLSQCDCG